MAEWRVTEVDMEEGALLSSSTSSSVIEAATPPSLLGVQVAGQRPSRRRSAAVTTTATATAAITLGDRFAPLERFLEAGRQMQQQQQLFAFQQQQSLANQQPPQQPPQNQQPQPTATRSNSHLRNKIVFSLNCRYCRSFVCGRAMRAILLADTKVELYSTDIPPSHHTATGDDDRLTHGCHCRIRDTLCRLCGNVLGYHVSQPCERCLMARNNGHFWMFYSEVVEAGERVERATGKALSWAQLAPMCQEEDGVELIGGYEQYSR